MERDISPTLDQATAFLNVVQCYWTPETKIKIKQRLLILSNSRVQGSVLLSGNTILLRMSLDIPLRSDFIIIICYSQYMKG